MGIIFNRRRLLEAILLLYSALCAIVPLVLKYGADESGGGQRAGAAAGSAQTAGEGGNLTNATAVIG